MASASICENVKTVVAPLLRA